jgi:methionyl-tRNA synthetase
MRFYLTTAIDYVNSTPHVGTAFEKIGADVLARYMRLSGARTFFLMGNDEHSENVRKAAVQAGLDPLAYCDRMEERFRAVWSKLDLSFDIFMRTTRPDHKAGVQELFRRIQRAGDIRPGIYTGAYCVSCEEYKKEADLVEGRCPTHRVPVERVQEENLFFALSKYRERLRQHIADHPEFVEPAGRRNEVLGWLEPEPGLEDISITRPGKTWGVEVPDRPDHRIYVWFDALINYITAVGFGSDPARFEELWPADVHVVGKDITRFHCVVWPAMLMSAGLPLPRRVFAHGFVYVQGQKMSKSLGTTVDPLDLCERFGSDALRYFLMREISFHGDGDFSLKNFVARYNADLANDLGNLVQRTVTLVHRYQDGRVRKADGAPAALREGLVGLQDRLSPLMRGLEFHRALEEIFGEVRRANQFLEETSPWTLGKRGEREPLARSLYAALEAVRIIATHLAPFMPRTSAQILQRLRVGDESGARVREWGALADGTPVEPGAPLFPRIKAEDE